MKARRALRSFISFMRRGELCSGGVRPNLFCAEVCGGYYALQPCGTLLLRSPPEGLARGSPQSPAELYLLYAEGGALLRRSPPEFIFVRRCAELYSVWKYAELFSCRVRRRVCFVEARRALRSLIV